MIKTEFGIIDEIDAALDYSEYTPEKYHCVYIDDDRYINDWWPRLCCMKTYFHNLNRPALGLSRCGVTLIPPESAAEFQDIVLSDKRIQEDSQLVDLAMVIKRAMEEHKYIIHYGV